MYEEKEKCTCGGGTNSQQIHFKKNAHRLAWGFINKNLKYIKYFDSADDMFQELMLCGWKYLHLFDENKGKFSTFLYKVFASAVNLKIRQVNQYKRKLNYNIQSLQSKLCETVILEDVIPDQKNLFERIDNKILFKKVLPFLSKQAYMVYFQGYTLKEVALAYNTTISALNSALRRNKEQIRRKLYAEVKTY